MILSDEDKKHITNSIKFLESKSEAELVAVVCEKSDDYAYFWLVTNLFLTFSISFFIASFANYALLDFLLLQVMIMSFLYFASVSFESQLLSLLPSFIKNRQASRYAKKIFNQLVATKTKSRVGMMFFVSTDERYVEILVDSGIEEKIEQKYWEDIVANFLKKVKQGKIADGYVQAIEECSGVLVEHFPVKTDDINELPDEVIEI